jgi:thiosulfate reductase cytochrome b subunit
MLAQVGYLALYAATLVQFADVARILADYFDVPELYALVSPAVLAMCGIAIRIYLISAVGWRHPLAGKKFTLLFPMLLIFDGVWAASPLLIWHTMDNFGLAFAGVALLAYVPFAQRTLMHAIYPERKTS